MEALQAEHDKSHLAAAAAHARRQNLERDLKQARIRIRELLDKSETDDELVAALTAERAAHNRAPPCAPHRSALQALLFVLFHASCSYPAPHSRPKTKGA